MITTFTASEVVNEWAQSHEYGCTIDGKPASYRDIVNLFTNIAMSDPDFADIISDTFDNILISDIEIDELIN